MMNPQLDAHRKQRRPRDTGRWTIDSEIAALVRLRDGLGDAFETAAATIGDVRGKVVTLGIGKSGHAAQKVAGTLRSVAVPSLYLNASDALHGDLGVVGDGDVALLFSKSGSTRELLTILPHLRSRAVTLIAVVGAPGSVLAREADIMLDASVEREGCPLDAAPMASVLAAQALGDALAAAVMAARGFGADDFARLHPGGALGARLTLSVRDVMRRGASLPAVDTRATLKQAVLEITRTASGAVCVMTDDGKLAGFITDGDVRRELLRIDDVGSVSVLEVMTTSPLTVPPGLALSKALMLLEQRDKPFLTAPVVDSDERCVGLLALHDAVAAHLNG